jgi:hypothetical protein
MVLFTESSPIIMQGIMVLLTESSSIIMQGIVVLLTESSQSSSDGQDSFDDEYFPVDDESFFIPLDESCPVVDPAIGCTNPTIIIPISASSNTDFTVPDLITSILPHYTELICLNIPLHIIHPINIKALL